MHAESSPETSAKKVFDRNGSVRRLAVRCFVFKGFWSLGIPQSLSREEIGRKPNKNKPKCQDWILNKDRYEKITYDRTIL